ncbi:hypothetical protein FMEXI_8717 [Fusarium mexicanum]|uniref:Uncharacterized protein n=1 Tax=Fusarium mexicanum TaxID=751941 RepID=A0A8H5MSM1_9HYPO|nr:hypothetical protein FMEXI_8717 [Fusarium mexicanum]
MGYLTEVVSNWKRLHEFLELADHVNQLASVFASVNQAELYWDGMYRLYSAYYSDDVVCFLANMLRRRMFQAIVQNPPGKKPTDLDGNPIDPAFFARVQRAFWLHQFALRRDILYVDWSANRIPIPGGKNTARILPCFLQRPDEVHIWRFLRMVELQRLKGTMMDHGIEDHHRMGLLYSGLFRWATIGRLGIQGAAFCLPSSGERCSMQLLFQLAAVNDQLMFFWGRYDFSTPSWFDGWFEKYPVSGSIEGFSIGADYSRLKGEGNRQQDKKL